MGPLEVLCGIVALVFTLYYYFTSTFDFWKSRGIRGPQPIPLFGNIKDVMLARKAMSDYLLEIYKRYKDESLIGVFARRTPILVVKDPNFIKDILIKDFSNFANRGLPIYEKTEPLSQHLVALEAKRWRPLRTKLSPVFTSGKLKEMFPLILECSEHLEQYVEKLASRNEHIECRELTAKYTTDVIGSCAFGIETNSLSDIDSEFRTMGREVFARKWYNVIRFRIREAAPWLYVILGYILPRTRVTKFFTRILMENIDYREKNNIVRHDFVDTLRELKRYPDKIDIELTDSIIASQAFVFFIAGFETSSTTMSHALYELAQNHKIQDRLREEINLMYTKNGDTLTYDNIKEMDYLDKVFKETLRKYPPATFLMRKSTSNYTFDGTKINIPKGQTIWIPVYAIQRDPDIYPDPDFFDPDRFNEEIMQTRNAMFYLPFGDGPRNCIGARFAIYQTKVGLIKILRNYIVDICDKTQIPYINDPKAFLLSPRGGIYLRITKIN
ncbi:cytochrome P450 6A1-like [Odontomachus brunneus]|uniref:cytochrome P450 6A1-like n=1 Tax=Odontomachus brunneus TaxID=486640 RepID=UPI0013F20EE9|nr:cytochrome P450 6A1-like [Odontomachus brunneus]XP_032669230.1 cytochrome P450 6A1-like [Odontomachus brunneus]